MKKCYTLLRRSNIALFVLLVLFRLLSISAAEEVSNPLKKINSLKMLLENENAEAQNEKANLRSHLQKCESFLSTLPPGDQDSINLTQKAIAKDKSAIAKTDLRIQEINKRLKLSDRARTQLIKGSGRDIGFSVSEIKGQVSIIRKGTNKKITLSENMQLNPGDKITTAKNSKASFVLLDGSRFSIGPESELELIEDNLNESLTKFTKGKLGISIATMKKLFYRRYQVRTPGAAVAVRGTKFDIEVDAKGKTHIFVHEGEVEVLGKAKIVAGESWHETEQQEKKGGGNV